jgi:hypothetical protein
MKRRTFLPVAAGAFAAFLTTACGSDNPTSGSAGGVGVQGMVLSDSASAAVGAADTRTATAQAKKVTVKVDGTSFTVDVSANGTFHFNGIPSGTFTLVFLADGVEVGRVVVTADDGNEVKIVVQVKAGELVVVQIEVDGADQGTTPGTSPGTSSCSVNGGKLGQGIELEGNVSSGAYPTFQMAVNGRSGFPIDVNASSASVSCIGSAKATSAAECKASIKTGAKVHVGGTLMTCTTSSAAVTATEVKVQKD